MGRSHSGSDATARSARLAPFGVKGEDAMVSNDTPWWADDPIQPGDFYEDCRYHPVLCVSADYSPEVDDLQGISLVDGGLGSCSPRHCGPWKLTAAEAIARRLDWAVFSAREISPR